MAVDFSLEPYCREWINSPNKAHEYVPLMMPCNTLDNQQRDILEKLTRTFR
ncbi:hypothetical protein [Candidatus Nitrosocosmicus sp. T]